ncbi:MAG: AmmeMemoRadiSam system radical SAM enzyme, partial [Victivallaceae bacterium]
IRPLSYGKICSLSNDPVEKKPLFHFLPGEKILSVGTLGCNFHCKNCQNFSISQLDAGQVGVREITPEQLLQIALECQSKMVAFTYSEPLVTFEYVLEAAKLLQSNDIKSVIVSAGYVMPETLEQLIPYLAGANIDLKSMNDEFYRENCGGRLAPVLDTLRRLYNNKVHLEITNLLIPGKNDSPDETKQLVDFVGDELGEEIPLHFSAFFPTYKMQNVPPTSPNVISNGCKIASERGLKYVYGGNIRQLGLEDTFCPQCGKLLIHREGFRVLENHLADGCCPTCQCQIYGVFE